MSKISSLIVMAFPLWVLLGVVLTLIEPSLFTWFTGDLITYGLGIIMLGMGMTIKAEDFANVLRMPRWVMTGIVLQYTVMPALGWFFAWVFSLPSYFAAGLIVVACCPGGTASNVVSYLARANVPLSVTMTSISTLMAIVLTPLLCTFIIGSKVEVNGWGLFFDTLKVILVPVGAGVLMNKYLPRLTRVVLPYAPVAATFTIVLIVASIIGAGKSIILTSGWKLLLSVIGLHAGGFLLGYLFAMLTVKNVQARQTISIEVGMQNSGLGVVLARNNFPHPATAIPAAISSAVHSLIGSILAGIWRWRNKEVS
ncbi:MAG TPA: bile acid:sodium symporter family protein [Bacteroidales bacterium]|nr:bile acid:sodium symporter family protein [Bacteroidales bacterium]HOK99632.1 bile acid:sodium symporter family protein [Bacteroidales bacterium]HPO66243.1 bile acid:sodium symporter family protein [Bacteroidales bacterium]